MPTNLSNNNLLYSVGDIISQLDEAGALNPALRGKLEDYRTRLSALHGSDVLAVTNLATDSDPWLGALSRIEAVPVPLNITALCSHLRTKQTEKLLRDLERALPVQADMRREMFRMVQQEICRTQSEARHTLPEAHNAEEWKQALASELSRSPFFGYMPAWAAAEGITVRVLERPANAVEIQNETCAGYANYPTMTVNVIISANGKPGALKNVITLGHEYFHIGQKLHAPEIAENDEQSNGIVGSNFVATRLNEADARTKHSLLTEDLINAGLGIEHSADYYAAVYTQEMIHYLKSRTIFPNYDSVSASYGLFREVQNGTWAQTVAQDYPLFTDKNIRKLATLPNGSHLPLSDKQINAIREAAIEGCTKPHLDVYEKAFRPGVLPHVAVPSRWAMYTS
jgi:hypothetical protein